MNKYKPSGRKAAVISLGCAKNLVDSEVMTGYLSQAGYVFTDDPQNSDVLIINTCGFIEPAKKEAVQAIQDALDLKKENPDIKIFVTGCYVQRNGDGLREEFPEVDGWTGVNDFDRIIELIEGKSYEKSENSFLYDHRSPRNITTSSLWAYVKISEGCSHRCSFCAIPVIKGNYRSRSVASIAEEVDALASKGVKEINLVSHDTTFYGKDMGMKEGLPRLLEQLLRIPDLSWIRILYGYPEEVTECLLDIMQEKKICSYLDLPFQHSSPSLLKAMKRGLPGEKALRLLDQIRIKLPEVALRTSLIVGFPGETDKDFRSLLSFVKEARFDHLGVFIYSPEEGTKSFLQGDPVSKNLKLRRQAEIMELQAEISLKRNQTYVGQKIETLIEGPLKAEPTIMACRGRFQAPEVDGLIFIDKEEAGFVGKDPIQNVEITNSDVYDLYGKFI